LIGININFQQKKLLISYKNTIKIYNINSLLLQSDLILDNIEKIENLYLLKNGLISICTKNIIFLIELNEDNTYKIFQKIENIECQDFKHLIELKIQIYVFYLKIKYLYINSIQ